MSPKPTQAIPTSPSIPRIPFQKSAVESGISSGHKQYLEAGIARIKSAGVASRSLISIPPTVPSARFRGLDLDVSSLLPCNFVSRELRESSQEFRLWAAIRTERSLKKYISGWGTRHIFGHFRGGQEEKNCVFTENVDLCSYKKDGVIILNK